NLAREYDDKAEFSRQNNELPPLNNPTAAASREVLALLSRVVLQNSEGVKGGFYAAASNTFLGDSYSATADSSANPPLDNSAADDRNAILDVAKSAAESHQPSERVLSRAAN